MQHAVGDSRAARIIRRQFSTPAMRRYVRDLQQFQIASDVPQYMLDMLSKIETTEMKDR